MKGLDGSLPAWCFCSRTWRCFGFCSMAWRSVGMRSPGMVGGLSGVEYGPAHDRFFCLANPGKKHHQSCRGFSLGGTSWFAPEQRQEGAHMHAVETAGEQSPGGNRGSQIGCADKRYFHTPTVVSPSHMLNTEEAMQFFLTHHLQDQHGWSPLACRCHDHRSGGVSSTWLFSRRELLRALPDEDNLCALAQANF